MLRKKMPFIVESTMPAGSLKLYTTSLLPDPQHTLDRAVRTSTATYLSAELLPRATAVPDRFWIVLGFHWLLLEMVHTQWKQLQIFNSNRKIKARCGS